MAYQQKEGQGSLFKNDKQNDRQPDLRGTIMIKGVTYEIAAWNRTSQNGREYISLQASEKQAQVPGQGGPLYAAPTPVQYAAPAPTYDDMPVTDSEDLPF